jgi:hypothetical protein
VSRIDDGAIIYANDAWIPRRALVPSDTDVEAPANAGLAAAARSNLGAVAKGVGGAMHDSKPAGPGTLLWAEAHNGGWHASAAGDALEHSAAFDWTNAFALPEHASVGIHFRAPFLTRLLILVELVVWVLALVAWRQTRAPRRRRRTAS